LVFFGEPAEKVCGSKPVHAAKGYYDNIDAFIAYHPWPQNTVEWFTHFGAYYACVFTFECVEPERWNDLALLPEGAGGRVAGRVPGAIDALMTMYMVTKASREAMFAHTGSWSLNELILAGGDATADNLPPRFAQIQYAWRSPDLKMQERIWQVLAHNAKHAAAMTGCEVSVRWVSKTRVALPNQALADLTWRNLALIGPPEYDEAARSFGREMQRNLGLEPMENPFPPELTRLTPPEEYETQLRAGLPPWQKYIGADDYVEYMWHAPTVRLLTARPRLRPPSPTYQYPAWTYLALGGRPEAVDPGMFTAGRTIAATLLDLATQPDELARARAEFVERTGGGVGGSRWVAPLLPRDIVPPIDLRWPEYITTHRGEEWWVPTPLTAGERL
jgi:aminobenzoyl-glutamate utilization protein B